MDLSEDCALLQPLEPVHPRDSSFIPAPTDYAIPVSSQSTHSARRNRDSRSQKYVSHIEMMMAKKSISEDSEDLFFKYFKTQRKLYDEDASCVWLLWDPLATSRLSACSVLKAIDIPIRSTGEASKRKASEEEVFLDMRRAFYKHTESWSSHLGLRTVTAVKPIKFRLIKLHEPGFLVRPMAADLSEDRERCQSRMDEIDEQLADRNNTEDFCYPDPDNDGKYTHTHKMCGYVNHTLSFEPTCPFEEWTNQNSRIDWIDSAAFLTYYFLYPDAAKDQNTLSSRFGENFLRQYSLIEYHLQRSEERRYLVLDGLHVEEQWRTPRAIVLVITVLFLVCMISRLIWKSWEIVFGAASFVATVAMLVLAMHDN